MAHKVYFQDFLGNWTSEEADTREEIVSLISQHDMCQRIEIEGVEFAGDVPEYDELFTWMAGKDDVSFNIPLAINAAYNPGEWRLSKQVIGPRDGKSWVKIHSTAATGGHYPNAQLTPGRYKVTWWSNNWPSSYQFEITEAGERVDFE